MNIPTSIPGLGEVTAFVMLAEMPELGTMDKREVAALAGLAPITRQSGNWQGKSFIRGGRTRVRKALYMPALVAIRFNQQFDAKYQALLLAGKPAKVAITAIMRKLIILANSLIRDNRIRLKGNLTLQHAGAEIVTGDVARFASQDIEMAELYGAGIITGISILNEKDHPEPWIIAMDSKPTPARVRDYGMRWGIEALFSDFKSRGFGITTTQLRHADRIERLVLVLTIALYFAVSTAMQPDINAPKYTPKKPIAA